MQSTCAHLASALPLVSLILFTTVAPGQIAVQQWVQRYNSAGGYPAAIAVDTNGDVIVTGTCVPYLGMDYATIKYSAAGVPLWTNRYDGQFGNDEPRGLALDNGGNVFVTGYRSLPSPNGSDYATVAYSSTGRLLWTRYDGRSDCADVPSAIAVDASGNVFVTGSSADTDLIPKHSILKFSGVAGGGASLWGRSYGDGAITSLAVDANGNAYVAGYPALIKYSPDGVPLWTNRFGGTNSWEGAAGAIAVDPSGDVIVTGCTIGTNFLSRDFATIKYSSAGAALWTNTFNGFGNDFGHGHPMAVDGSANVFVTATFYVDDTNSVWATLAYSNSGVPLWTNYYCQWGAGGGSEAIAVDANGNVWVAGYTATNETDCVAVTIAYSGAGIPLCTNTYDGATNGEDVALAIAADVKGSVYVVGDSATDFVTIKYSLISPIPLSIERLDNHIVLSWTNAAFHLQTAPAINAAFTNVPGATSPWTNSLAASPQFFRLQAP